MKRSEKYDWKDSNVELIGSSDDRHIKKSSAETESAWNEAKECDHSKLFVWRIEKFNVVEWPSRQFGEFYEGDSYIILNVYQIDEELHFDIHFWIGKYSTQDEYGTAAYKTVELDTLLDDRPVQHREVQHFESDLFKSYFPSLIYLKGGHETGFRHVETKEYTPRLLRFKGEKRKIIVSEVHATKKNLNSDDVFIFDTGSKIYQWMGKGSNKDERFRAQQFAQQLNSDRNGKLKIEVHNEDEMTSSHEFYRKFSDEEPEDDERNNHILSLKEKQLFRISDETGSLKFERIASGDFTRSNINENDVFIIDNGQIIYVYVGANASPNERKNALVYAHNYLKETDYPQVPITVVKKDIKGPSAEQFNKVIDGQ